MYTHRVTSFSQPSSSCRRKSTLNRFDRSQSRRLPLSKKTKCESRRRKVTVSSQPSRNVDENDDDNDDKAYTDAQKANFWNVFLTDAIEISGSGVPKFKRYKTEENKTSTNNNQQEQSHEEIVKGTGFLQRLTLIGLILSICFFVSAIQVTHFPTVKWCLMNPVELLQNSEVSREVMRRLIAPLVRYLASFFFARWRIRWALGFAVLSFIAPAVEFD
jgi:hypothetical protein